MENYSEERGKLRQFLEHNGISIHDKKNTFLCIAHSEKTPSMVLYENEDADRVQCFGCGAAGDIFDVAGMFNNTSDFKEQLGIVRETLRISKPVEKKTRKTSKTIPKPIAVPYNKAGDIYNKDFILKISKDKDWGEIKGKWYYNDTDGNLLAVDIRFEKPGEKKDIITFWYDGKLKWYGSPVFIYGLDLLKNDKPIVIHEGAKCAEIGNKNLPEFNHIAWSGGSGKTDKIDWSFLENKEVFILRDDDHQKYASNLSDKSMAGKEKPAIEQMGVISSLHIQEKLPNSKIINPPEQNIKKSGGDIEEFLQVLSPDELTKYILSPENIESFDAVDPKEPEKPDKQTDNESVPFKILGMGDDGRANFIDQFGFLHQIKLSSLSKNVLMDLSDLEYWRSEHGNGKNGVEWDECQNYVIMRSKVKDFNQDNIRGRGAWRDGNKLSYNDGVNTIGEWDPKRLYLRQRHHDIGLGDAPLSADLRKEIKDTVEQVSFESSADAVRTLGWSVLAPFAGALFYRPAILLTGVSGSGKSTVANLIIRKLADCEWFNGSESTVAGVRGKIKYDSRGIMFEEAETDTLKKSLNRNELFSLMRVNVSNDAPDTVKGTKDGGYNSFKMQNMFGFIAINPTVESIADENRIFRINMIKSPNQRDWKKLEKLLIKILDDKACRGIRSLTWKKLQNIMDMADNLVEKIREKTNRDLRSSYSDALLFAAYMIIWQDVDEMTDKQIDIILTKHYEDHQMEEHRDEAGEIIDRLLDETIEIISDGSRRKLTIIECIVKINNSGVGKDDAGNPLLESTDIYKDHLARYGLRLLENGDLAIANKHHEIKRIIQAGDGYNKILRRHKGFVDSQRVVYFFNDSKSKRCTIIKGLFEEKEEKEIEFS